jgi:hypothetical protein
MQPQSPTRLEHLHAADLNESPDAAIRFDVDEVMDKIPNTPNKEDTFILDAAIHNISKHVLRRSTNKLRTTILKDVQKEMTRGEILLLVILCVTSVIDNIVSVLTYIKG